MSGSSDNVVESSLGFYFVIVWRGLTFWKVGGGVGACWVYVGSVGAGRGGVGAGWVGVGAGRV